MKLKHTTGPWKANNGYILGADGYPIANITYVSMVDSENKKLIIAAPDLLDALIAARDELAKHIVFKEYEKLITKINNAINKATK